jgi:hypothetical protein
LIQRSASETARNTPASGTKSKIIASWIREVPNIEPMNSRSLQRSDRPIG